MVDIDTSAYVPEKPGGPLKRLLGALGRGAYALSASSPDITLAKVRDSPIVNTAEDATPPYRATLDPKATPGAPWGIDLLKDS